MILFSLRVYRVAKKKRRNTSIAHIMYMKKGNKRRGKKARACRHHSVRPEKTKRQMTVKSATVLFTIVFAFVSLDHLRRCSDVTVNGLDGEGIVLAQIAV